MGGSSLLPFAPCPLPLLCSSFSLSSSPGSGARIGLSRWVAFCPCLPLLLLLRTCPVCVRSVPEFRPSVVGCLSPLSCWKRGSQWSRAVPPEEPSKVPVWKIQDGSCVPLAKSSAGRRSWGDSGLSSRQRQLLSPVPLTKASLLEDDSFLLCSSAAGPLPLCLVRTL